MSTRAKAKIRRSSRLLRLSVRRRYRLPRLDLDEVKKGADGDSGRAFGAEGLRLVAPGRARDVEVRPRYPFGELLDEGGGGDRPGLATADILDVGDVGLDLLRVLLVERELPELLADLAARLDDFVNQLLIRSEQTCVHVAERDGDCARQRRHVYDARRAELLGVGNCVGEDETAFGVRVDDLDGLARHRAHDIARLRRLARRHVLCGGDDAKDGNRRLELRDG